MTTWDPQTYLRYADLRFRAGLDLLVRIPKAEYASIYDLGCGTGHLTRVLADTFPNSEVIGIDSAPEMLTAARFSPSAAFSWSPGASTKILHSSSTPAEPLHPAYLPHFTSLTEAQNDRILDPFVPYFLHQAKK